MQAGIVDWVNTIKANDDRVLKKLYQDHYPKVERYVLANNGDRDQAKDIYQEAFIVCWTAIQQDKFFPENETSTGGYIYKVAKYKWLDYLRSGHYRKVVALEDDGQEWDLPFEEQNKEDEERIKKVRLLFGKLGDNCRDLLTRFYYGKQSLRVIAAAFSWTEASARNNKYRCLQRLKDLINNK